jgi:type II secretory pathway pseudopilin PulG
MVSTMSRSTQPPRRLQCRSGISLIETIVCVAIVATMSTAIVGIMQNSVRFASASRLPNGSAAKSRQVLRHLSSQLQRWDESEGIESLNNSVVRTRSHTYRFVRRRSVTGIGRDLICQDEAGSETVFVLGELVEFEMTAIPGALNPNGIEMRLRLRNVGDEANQYILDNREAEIRTHVCFPPQLRASS